MAKGAAPVKEGSGKEILINEVGSDKPEPGAKKPSSTSFCAVIENKNNVEATINELKKEKKKFDEKKSSEEAIQMATEAKNKQNQKTTD